MKQQQGGFTLAELLVVITIIGILAALVLPGIVNALFQGNMVACQSNLGELFNKVKTYQSSNQGSSPPAMGGGGASNWAIYLKDNGKGEGDLNNKLFFCPVRDEMPKKKEELAAQDGDYMYNVNENGLSPLSSASKPDTILAGDCVSRNEKASSHGKPENNKVNFLLKNNSVQSAGKGEGLFQRAMKAGMVAGTDTKNPACPVPSASSQTGNGMGQDQSGQNGQSGASSSSGTSGNTSN